MWYMDYTITKEILMRCEWCDWRTIRISEKNFVIPSTNPLQKIKENLQIFMQRFGN